MNKTESKIKNPCSLQVVAQFGQLSQMENRSVYGLFILLYLVHMKRLRGHSFRILVITNESNDSLAIIKNFEIRMNISICT